MLTTRAHATTRRGALFAAPILRASTVNGGSPVSMRRYVLLTSAAVLLGSLLVAPHATAAPTEPETGPAASGPPSSPTVIYDNLVPGVRKGERAGPAPLMPGSAAAAAAATAADLGTTSVVCDGDGTSNERIEVLYVREPSMPDRYTQLLPVMRAWLANADDAFNDAAAEHGYSRHLRFVTEPAPSGGCQPVIHNLVVAAGALATFDSSVNAVKAAGFTEPNDRKYLMLTEAAPPQDCGAFVNWTNYDEPGQYNPNNWWTTYGRIDATPGCLGASAIGHEIAHGLGAVMQSAPHSDGVAHCTDGIEMLCGGNSGSACLEWKDRFAPDCNRDDYFHPNPAAGSYLATHWNIANSDFFIKGNSPDVGSHPRLSRTYAITSVSTGGAIEVIDGGTADGIKLSQRTRTDVASQRWLATWDLGMQFNNVNSGRCMAPQGSTSGSHAGQQACVGGAIQTMRWSYQPHGDGTYGILNWDSGLALTVGGAYPTPLTLTPYTGAANQRFQFNQLTVPAPQHNSIYTLTGFGSLENMQVQGGSTTSGALVTHAAPSTANSQRWRLQVTGSYWKLVNVNSNHCLDLMTANNTAGTQIRQATCGSANSQQWTLRRLGDGTFVLVNRHSNLVLNMTTGSGSILDQQALDGENRHHAWTLKPI